LTVVADQFGCATAARDIASACFEIALRCAASSEEMHYGTYHFAGNGDASWFEFANTIVAMASSRIGTSPQVVLIRAVDTPRRLFVQLTADWTARRLLATSGSNVGRGVRRLKKLLLVYWPRIWHEGDHSCRRLRNPALPGNTCYQQAALAGL
jgi:hypothetical protein